MLMEMCIKASGRMVIRMGKVEWYGQMERFMKDIGLMIFVKA